MSEIVVDAPATAWLPRLPQGTGFVLRTLLAFALAVYAAYALELESPSSAGTTVLIVAAGARGAILSKSFWRIVGSAVGVGASVAMIACFVQAPVLFILMLAIWLGICTGASSLLRHFRSYGALLAGYTVTLVALPAVADPDRIFDLAMARLAVVVLGVLSTALVFLATDRGPKPDELRRQAARLFADTARLIRGALADSGRAPLADTRSRLATGVMAIDQAVEFTAAEDAVFGHRSGDPRLAAAALLSALTGVERVATLLSDPAVAGTVRIGAAREILARLTDWLVQPNRADDVFAVWRERIAAARAEIDALAAGCRDLPVLAALEQAGDLLAQLHLAADRFAILHGEPSTEPTPALLMYANPVTALRNGVRAALAVGMAGLFWIESQWPTGGAMLGMLGPVCGLMAQTDSAAAASVQFLKGTALSSVAALIVNFIVLPQTTGFPLLMAAMLPVLAFGLYAGLRPGAATMWSGFCIFFVGQLAPDNPMRFDLAGALNTYTAFFVGGVFAVLAFRVLVPPNPRHEATVLLHSIRNGMVRLRWPRNSQPLAWEHLQHQKLIHLSRRLAAEPAARLAAVQSGIGGVLIGRALLRLHGLLAARAEMPAEAEAAVMALRRLARDPQEAASAAEQAAATLMRREAATVADTRLAATLHELGALIASHAGFIAGAVPKEVAGW